MRANKLLCKKHDVLVLRKSYICTFESILKYFTWIIIEHFQDMEYCKPQNA